jgi:DNA-binding MarR family transcriptional regulator
MQTTPAGRLPEELVASSLFLLKRLGHAAKVKTLDAYEKAGLGPYHYAVLAALDEGVRDTQGAIADSLGYDRGTLVGLLDDLEERGLVERRRDPGDRRRHLVGLTTDGRKELDRLRAVSRQVEDDFLGVLDDAQRAELHDLLLRLAGRHEPRSALAPLP